VDKNVSLVPYKKQGLAEPLRLEDIVIVEEKEDYARFLEILDKEIREPTKKKIKIIDAEVIYTTSQRYKERYYDKILQKDKRNEIALYEKAKILTENKKYKDAIKLYDRISEINPTGIITRLHKGAILIKLGRFIDAESEFREVLAQDRKNIYGLVGRAEALYRIGKSVWGRAKRELYLNNALEYLDQAIKICPTLETAWFIEGNIYGALGMKQQAWDCFSSYETIDTLKKINFINEHSGSGAQP